jgi:hypothetical protein
VHDFSDDYTKLHSSLNAQLQNHQKGNLTLNGRFDRLDVKDVYLDLDELRIGLEAAGAVDMELEPSNTAFSITDYGSKFFYEFILLAVYYRTASNNIFTDEQLHKINYSPKTLRAS